MILLFVSYLTFGICGEFFLHAKNIFTFFFFVCNIFLLFIIVLLFICAYNAWVISPPCPHPLPYHPLRPLHLLPTPSIPGRNYFALISNFVEERV
jgi:hypothetical protein